MLQGPNGKPLTGAVPIAKTFGPITEEELQELDNLDSYLKAGDKLMQRAHARYQEGLQKQKELWDKLLRSTT